MSFSTPISIFLSLVKKREMPKFRVFFSVKFNKNTFTVVTTHSLEILFALLTYTKSKKINFPCFPGPV